jgi:hypothetical protein
MPHIRTRRQFIQFGKPALAALLVGIILLLDAMAACPALHELIHKDAGQADHDCAVTMFAHGKMDSTIIDLPVIVVVVSFVAEPRIEFSVFRPAIENLPASRAPPLPCSVS